MPRYAYQSYDQHGALKAGEIEASSRQAALDALHRQGQFPFDISEPRADQSIPWWQREVFASTTLPLADLGLLTREMATLIKAEVPLDDTLRLVSLQPLMPARTRGVVDHLFHRVREGAALSEALQQSNRFPEYYWRLVQAGEASGALGSVLDELFVLLERSIELRRQIVTALLYPLTLLMAAMAAVVVIVTVLLPTIVPLFKDAGAALPTTVHLMAEGRDFVQRYWIALLLLAAVAIAGGAVALRDRRARLKIDRLLLRLPVVGRLITDRETARFARTLSTLTHNGVPLLEAVRITANVMRNTAFAAATAQIGERLKEGRVLSVPMVASGLFSELAVRLTGIGEQTGQLAAMLLQVAVIYEATLQRQLARLMSLVTPVLTLLIGGLVGGLILSVMNAILSVNELVFK